MILRFGSGAGQPSIKEFLDNFDEGAEIGVGGLDGERVAARQPVDADLERALAAEAGLLEAGIL